MSKISKITRHIDSLPLNRFNSSSRIVFPAVFTCRLVCVRQRFRPLVGLPAQFYSSNGGSPSRTPNLFLGPAGIVRSQSEPTQPWDLLTKTAGTWLAQHLALWIPGSLVRWAWESTWNLATWSLLMRATIMHSRPDPQPILHPGPPALLAIAPMVRRPTRDNDGDECSCHHPFGRQAGSSRLARD